MHATSGEDLIPVKALAVVFVWRGSSEANSLSARGVD